MRHCELGPALRSRTGLDETVRWKADGIFWRAVGKEVGFSLVRESPVASWTRVAWMTLTGAEGQYCPGARFLGFFSNRRLCRRRKREGRRARGLCMSEGEGRRGTQKTREVGGGS